jgi:hypothetical protein
MGTRGFRQVWTSMRIKPYVLCSWCIMIRWVETPSALLLYAKGVGFIRNDRVGFNLTWSRLYLYLPNLQDISMKYLLNHLGNGPPGPGLQAEWADSWKTPLFLLSESSWHGTHGTKPRQQSPSASQMSLGLENSSLPPSGEIAECSILFEITNQVPDNLVECH